MTSLHGMLTAKVTQSLSFATYLAKTLLVQAPPNIWSITITLLFSLKIFLSPKLLTQSKKNFFFTNSYVLHSFFTFQFQLFLYYFHSFYFCSYKILKKKIFCKGVPRIIWNLKKKKSCTFVKQPTGGSILKVNTNLPAITCMTVDIQRCQQCHQLFLIATTSCL